MLRRTKLGEVRENMFVVSLVCISLNVVVVKRHVTVMHRKQFLWFGHLWKMNQNNSSLSLNLHTGWKYNVNVHLEERCYDAAAT